ncbi:hypothetical protein IGI04_010499 [Brassica rapa subsp. trilocularis]|uniref:Small ribosomal subunit protein uS7 domain-containing protein n=1 Tax=Brassica rapa subsp. trilocularis TaxID=1813537 RepID=A0ABQ7N2U9_BRACM|nr:hypothetical protein IGI04_010499 [Brassica rapa subsp. trilocularis]
MTIDTFNYNTRCRGLLRTSSASKKMEEEEKEGMRTVECLRGRLLAERQASRSAKEEAELITKKMEELEEHLKEEIRLREKAEKRLKYLMRKLEYIKGSRSSESSSEASCLSYVSTSASKEEEKETHENENVKEDKIDQATENVDSAEKKPSSKLKDGSSGEASVVASTSSHEGESQAGEDFLNCSVSCVFSANPLSTFPAMAAAVEIDAEIQQQLTNEVKLFKRWSFDDVSVTDISLVDYIGVQPAKHATFVPHTAGRYSVKRFRKAQCPIVERLTNSLMMHGRNNGKKLMAVRIIKHAMEIIHLLTDANPIQVIIDAIVNSGPREDATRIGSAGVVRRQAVDISPLRRVNQAIFLLTTGAREAAFRNIKTIAECLADELINAAKGSSNSYAIKKKDEIERVAKANR